MNENTHSARSLQARRRPLTGTLAGAALGAVLLLGACDGDNLFEGPGRTVLGPPLVTSIDAPASIAEGATLDVRIKAIAPRGMTSVQVRLRRAINEDKTFDAAGRADTVTIDVPVVIPAQTSDSILVIDAFAIDASGRVSDVRSDTVRIIDSSPPAVTAAASPDRAIPGGELELRVTALDRLGLQSFGYVLLSADGDTLAHASVPTSGAQRDTVFLIPVPPSLPGTELRVLGVAVNAASIRGVSAPLLLPIVDELPPIVNIINPVAGQSFPLADSLLVRVHVADSGGIAELRIKGVAIRGDSLSNTVVVDRYDEVVVPLPQVPNSRAPRDTTIVRFLRPLADTTSEQVLIIATATDNIGNVRADTVRITDGPRITILSPVENQLVGLNRSLLVDLSAADRTSALDRITIRFAGVRTDSIVLAQLGGRQAVDTTLSINTGSVQGDLTLQASVTNVRGVVGVGQPVRVQVASGVVTDSVPPRVLRRVEAGSRIELTDSIAVTVVATDGSGSGIARVGAVLTIIPDDPAVPPRTLYRSTATFDPPLSGSPSRTFYFEPGELYTEQELLFPRRFAVQVHAFAIDAEGNCGASIGTELVSLPCDSTTSLGTTFYTARGSTPPTLQLTGVSGKSVQLPGGGRIADAVVDAPRNRVYLSNIENNKIDIFHLGVDTFDVTSSVTRRGLVGAAPWGLVVSNNADSLYVANSGGTNISVLPLDGASYMIEDVPRRILTPNTLLFNVQFQIEEGVARYTDSFIDFSDRPQFIAQHSSGTLVYSTWPTSAATLGTLRYVDTNIGDLPEVYLLHHSAVTDDPTTVALALIDSLDVIRALNGSVSDRIVIYDHIPGDTVVIFSPLIGLPLNEAIDSIRALGSDVENYSGRWDINAVGLRDTTFVAASTDRNVIAFGEGVAAPVGRIFLCCTVSPGPPLKLGVSSEIAVEDLIGNAAERVFGLGLNADGSLGVARGSQAAYFFSRDLRLQGEFRGSVAGGTGGASLHPDHRGVLSGDQALAFIATGQRTIKIVDAVHFYERGEIHLRDNVVGPLRAIVPDAAENLGVSQLDPNYIVVKVLAVTEGGNVVIVNVRRKDLPQ